VSAGTAVTPVLLVHGFPESWWAFREIIPLLAASRRVYAVDLRGFGDSAIADEHFDSAAAANDLHELITDLGGPVHIVAQDIAGGSVFRLAATHPADVRSFIAIERGLAGFGLEGFGDVTHGGPGTSACWPHQVSLSCCSLGASVTCSVAGRSRR
jgi:pimeloyl-ACP methyl ester carboxylesterase